MLCSQRIKNAIIPGVALLAGSLILAIMSISVHARQTQDVKASLEVIAPEDAGWSSEKLEEAKAFAEKINSAAIMVL